MIPKAILDRINEKFQVIQAKRPLSPIIVEKLKEQFSLELTYNSNAIEGNKLTLKETYLVIQDGLTVKGKSLKDHLEAKNHNEAIQYLYELIEHGKRHTISENLIRSLQHLINKEIDTSEAGSYRKGNVLITGSQHTPPDAYEIPKLMQEFVSWIKKSSNKLHPVSLTALAHHRLVHIHPFADGNGRTARLFMNLLLMQRGFPMVTILKNDRKKYYQALDRADNEKTDDLEKFIAQAVERSINIYLKAIQSGNGSSAKLLKLSELAKGIAFQKKKPAFTNLIRLIYYFNLEFISISANSLARLTHSVIN